MSLRRLRYQLECRRSGHDLRPSMVDGGQVAQRCLRCGAIVDEAGVEVATEAAPDHAPAPRPEPQPSNLPPAPSERRGGPKDETVPEAAEEPGVAAEEAENGEEATRAALTALRELGELHAAGVLTDREFARKKAELLRRV